MAIQYEGRVETLMLAGGIGGNTSEVWDRICDGLRFLGIELDEARNAVNAPLGQRPIYREF